MVATQKTVAIQILVFGATLGMAGYTMRVLILRQMIPMFV